MRCRCYYKPLPKKEKGTKNVLEPKDENPCLAAIDVARSTAKKTKGMFKIVKVQATHGLCTSVACTSVANPTSAALARNSNFRSIVAGNRGISAKGLNTNLRKDSVAASSRKISRAKTNVLHAANSDFAAILSKLKSYGQYVEERNPGTKVHINSMEVVNNSGDKTKKFTSLGFAIGSVALMFNAASPRWGCCTR